MTWTEVIDRVDQVCAPFVEAGKFPKTLFFNPEDIQNLNLSDKLTDISGLITYLFPQGIPLSADQSLPMGQFGIEFKGPVETFTLQEPTVTLTKTEVLKLMREAAIEQGTLTRFQPVSGQWDDILHYGVIGLFVKKLFKE